MVSLNISHSHSRTFSYVTNQIKNVYTYLVYNYCICLSKYISIHKTFKWENFHDFNNFSLNHVFLQTV